MDRNKAASFVGNDFVSLIAIWNDAQPVGGQMDATTGQNNPLTKCILVAAERMGAQCMHNLNDGHFNS